MWLLTPRCSYWPVVMLLILIAMLTRLVSSIRKMDWSVRVSFVFALLSHPSRYSDACMSMCKSNNLSVFVWFSLSLFALDNLTTQTHTHWSVLCIRSFSQCLTFHFLPPDVLTTLTLACPLFLTAAWTGTGCRSCRSCCSNPHPSWAACKSSLPFDISAWKSLRSNFPLFEFWSLYWKGSCLNIWLSQTLFKGRCQCRDILCYSFSPSRCDSFRWTRSSSQA